MNAPADAIGKINEQFLNDYSHVRAGFFAELSGDVDHGMAEYEKALAINPNCGPAHVGYKVEGVSKMRICKKCGQELPTKK